MTYQFLTTRREGAVEYLTLNRPDVRNAFNEQMIAELARGPLRCPKPRGVTRCARSCSPGRAGVLRRRRREVDVERRFGTRRPRTCATRRRMAAMFAALDELPVPLICRIHGAAIGGGAGLAAVSDIVVAEDRAIFGFPEVKLGIVPAIIGPFVLAKIGQVRRARAVSHRARVSAARARRKSAWCTRSCRRPSSMRRVAELRSARS